MQALQWTAMSIINNASRLAISKEMASDSVVCVVVSKATTDVHEALLVEAAGRDMEPFCKAFTPDLCKIHGGP